MYRYYCIMRPTAQGAIQGGATKICSYDDRLYVHEIDRMALGWVEYANPLTPAEIADYELISAPKEDK